MSKLFIKNIFLSILSIYLLFYIYYLFPYIYRINFSYLILMFNLITNFLKNALFFASSYILH